MFSLTMQPRMTSVFWPNSNQRVLKQSLLVVIGSLIIAAASQIAIPLQPVPITLQTFAVMMIGCVYGWRLGLATVALYLFEGAMGLPVFAGFNAGFPILLGTNAGYLWGFLPAVALSGFLLERGWAKYRVTAFIAALLGDTIILALGVLFLANFIGFHQALLLGFVPFILAEVIKLVVLAVIIPKFWKTKKA